MRPTLFIWTVRLTHLIDGHSVSFPITAKEDPKERVLEMTKGLKAPVRVTCFKNSVGYVPCKCIDSAIQDRIDWILNPE
jgi:hypothetical protein